MKMRGAGLLASVLVATACSGGGSTEIPAECQANGATTSDAIICPRVSPIVLEPPVPGDVKTFAEELNNFSTRSDLVISEARIEGRDAQLFGTPQISSNTIKAGDVGIVQFTYSQEDLSLKCAQLVIISNAKNYPELRIGIAIRKGQEYDADGGRLDAGDPNERCP